MKLYQLCVYSIVSRDILDAVALERRPLIRSEGKAWVTAASFMKNAVSEGSHVPIVLGDATACARLLYWGLLQKVGIKNSKTEYIVDRLRPLRGIHSPQELTLKSSGEYITLRFIKPYALCHTPEFLIESPSEPERDTFLSPEEGVSPETFAEGRAIRVTVNAYERNIQARHKCIEHYGCTCSSCGFDFERTYGAVGRGFIHVHHIKPLSEIGERYEVNPIQDLRPVCPNCHAMIHKQSPALSIEELKALIKRAI